MVFYLLHDKPKTFTAKNMDILLDSEGKMIKEIFSIRPCSKIVNKSSSVDDCEIITSENSAILGIFVLFTLVCALVNSRIIYVMLVNTNRNNRYINLLVAQYSTIIFLYCDCLLVSTFQRQLINLFPMAGTGFCESFTFFQKLMSGAFPLNTVALIYERMRVDNLINCVGGIWLVAVLVNIPCIFMVKYTRNPVTKFEHCKETLLFKSQDITLAYEWTRFFVFFIAVSFYMAYAIFNVLGQIRSRNVVQGNGIRSWKRWPKRKQLVVFHAVLFLLIWLPMGTTRFIYKVLCVLKQIESVEQFSTSFLLEIVCTYILLIACPLLYVLMNKDVGSFNLLPRNVLGAVCNENTIRLEKVFTVTANGISGNWRRILQQATTINEEDEVNIEMHMSGMERVSRSRVSGVSMDNGTSAIPVPTCNFDQSVRLSDCVVCDSEMRQHLLEFGRE